MILDQNRKAHCVFGAMTMYPSYHTFGWVLKSVVSMCPMAEDVIEGTMSDLGIGITPIQDDLPNVHHFGAYTWHIMAIDFPKNIKHILGYKGCKKHVYDKFVRNTVSKHEWDQHLQHVCNKWPTAATYL